MKTVAIKYAFELKTVTNVQEALKLPIQYTCIITIITIIPNMLKQSKSKTKGVSRLSSCSLHHRLGGLISGVIACRLDVFFILDNLENNTATL